MPPTVVQFANNLDANVVFPSNNTVHNTLLVLVVFEGVVADNFTVVDTAGNVYTSLAVHTNGPGPGVTCQLFMCLDCVAGANTVRGRAFAGAVEQVVGVTCAIQEISGITTLDTSAFATGTGLVQDSGAIVTLQNIEFLFGYEAANVTTGQASVTEGVGWTLIQKNTVFVTQYKLTGVIGSYNSTSSSTVGKGGTCHWVEEVVALYTPFTPSPQTSVITF